VVPYAGRLEPRVIVNPLIPGFYGRTNQLLLQAAGRSVTRLAEDWQDEASEFALAGNAERAGYLEFIRLSLLGQ
jgi:hypothetical protein